MPSSQEELAFHVKRVTELIQTRNEAGTARTSTTADVISLCNIVESQFSSVTKVIDDVSSSSPLLTNILRFLFSSIFTEHPRLLANIGTLTVEESNEVRGWIFARLIGFACHLETREDLQEDSLSVLVTAVKRFDETNRADLLLACLADIEELNTMVELCEDDKPIEFLFLKELLSGRLDFDEGLLMAHGDECFVLHHKSVFLTSAHFESARALISKFLWHFVADFCLLSSMQQARLWEALLCQLECSSEQSTSATLTILNKMLTTSPFVPSEMLSSLIERLIAVCQFLLDCGVSNRKFDSMQTAASEILQTLSIITPHVDERFADVCMLEMLPWLAGLIAVLSHDDFRKLLAVLKSSAVRFLAKLIYLLGCFGYSDEQACCCQSAIDLIGESLRVFLLNVNAEDVECYDKVWVGFVLESVVAELKLSGEMDCLVDCADPDDDDDDIAPDVQAELASSSDDEFEPEDSQASTCPSDDVTLSQISVESSMEMGSSAESQQPAVPFGLKTVDILIATVEDIILRMNQAQKMFTTLKGRSCIKAVCYVLHLAKELNPLLFSNLVEIQLKIVEQIRNSTSGLVAHFAALNETNLRQELLDWTQLLCFIVSAHDTCCFTDEALHCLCFCLSLAWLPLPLRSQHFPKDIQHCLFKLPSNVTRDSASIADSSTVASQYDMQLFRSSLQALILLPNDICAEWRFKVLRFSMRELGSTSQLIALELLPLFIYRFRSEATDILDELVVPLFPNALESSLILEACCEFLGQFYCRSAESASVTWKLERSFTISGGFYDLTLDSQCSICSANSFGVQELRNSKCNAQSFLLFFGIVLQSGDVCTPAVKTAFCKSLARALRHFNEPDNSLRTLLRESLCLMDDACGEVLSSYAVVLGIMLSRGFVSGIGDELTALIDRFSLDAQVKYFANLSRVDVSSDGGRELFGNSVAGLTMITLGSDVDETSASKAVSALEEIAEWQGQSMKELFVESAGPIWYMIVKRLTNDIANMERGKIQDFIKRSFERFAFTFGYLRSSNGAEVADVEHFLDANMKYMLPLIILKASEPAAVLCKVVAKLLNTNRQNLIAMNFRHILLQITIVGLANSDEIFAFIEAVGSPSPRKSDTPQSSLASRSSKSSCDTSDPRNICTIDDYMNWDLYNSLFELLKNLSVNTGRVLHVVEHLSNLEKGKRSNGKSKGPQAASDSNDSVAIEAIRSRLLGILAKFEAAFKDSKELLRDKVITLKSLVELMSLTKGAIISECGLKVLATLRVASSLENAEFRKLCCGAWCTFIQCLEVATLAALLNQIVVSILPLTRTNVRETAVCFQRLVDAAKREPSVMHRLLELSFVLMVPELKDIRPHFAVVEAGFDAAAENLITKIRRALIILKHENNEVKALALCKLRHVLADEQVELNALVNSEPVHAVISELMVELMIAINSRDPDVQDLSAQCVGQVGAIDPGKLKLESISSVSAASVKANGNGPTTSYAAFDVGENSNEEANVVFAREVLVQLTRVFLSAADGNLFDACAFAVQEVLKFYKCTRVAIQEGPASRSIGARVWFSLPESIQVAVEPMLSTSFTSKMAFYDPDSFPNPIYRSQMGLDFKSWIRTWLISLIPLIQHHEARSFFKHCSIVATLDFNIAVFLLPHIILRLLQERNEHVKSKILDEMLAVLDDSTVHQNSYASVSSDVVLREVNRLASQVVFSIIDGLGTWLRTCQPSSKADHSDRSRLEKERQCAFIRTFLSALPERTVAESAYACKAYARALFHLEAHIKLVSIDASGSANSDVVQDNLGFLQKIYARLDEPDNVFGALTVRKRVSEPSHKEHILAYESAGLYTDALPFHQMATSSEPENLGYRVHLMSCLMKINQPELVQKYLDSALRDNPDWEQSLNSYYVEASWKLQDWNGLSSALDQKYDTFAWGATMGSLMHSVWQNDYDSLQKLVSARQLLTMPIAAAAMEISPYERAYKHIGRLHMLTELEQSLSGIELMPDVLTARLADETESIGRSGITSPEDLLKLWRNRQKFVEGCSRSREPIFELRRKLLSMDKTNRPEIQTEIGRLWLESARWAMKAGHLQSAWSFILNAKTYKLPECFVDEAKYYWQKSEAQAALATLTAGIKEHYPNMNRLISKSSSAGAIKIRAAAAKAQLLLAFYSEESHATDEPNIIKMYETAVELSPDWEAPYYHLGRYYDHLWQFQHTNKYSEDKRSRIHSSIHAAVTNYGESMKYGSSFVHDSMPRMLTIWLDFGAKTLLPVSKHSRRRQHHLSSPMAFPMSQSDAKFGDDDKVLQQLNTFVYALFGQVPSYQFYTAMSQLISRILHPEKSVVDVLEHIIAKLIVAYPWQCLWMCIAVIRSQRADRVAQMKAILEKAERMNIKLTRDQIIPAITHMADRLDSICSKKVDNSPKLSNAAPLPGGLRLSFKNDFQSPIYLAKSGKPIRVLAPLQRCMEVTLPFMEDGDDQSSQSNSSFSPFAKDLVYIEKFDDSIEVLASMQKPKRVTFVGSDGQRYGLMCKPVDDLRQDSRLMEFNNLLNGLLQREPDARRRQLYIRTYVVIALNERNGLIEWVPNLEGMRPAILQLYKESGVTHMRAMDMKRALDKLPLVEGKLAYFEETIFPAFRPILSVWFRKMFPDPSTWLAARRNYVHTLAVMSMVGFVVGLGDRHGENILLDKQTGDAIHVDFNMLFNKADKLEFPELVPFRLTRSVIDAMGPLGYEGSFRRSCEVTLRLMRNNREMLQNVLQTFIHDPLIEGTRQNHRMENRLVGPQPLPGAAVAESVARQNSAEADKEKAMAYLKEIATRLRGCVKRELKGRYTNELSVEGQVNYLIEQATNNILLCQMYLGWCAYL